MNIQHLRRHRRVVHARRLLSRRNHWGDTRRGPNKEDATSADVTLHQLRYFAVLLGEELNYRRAAERLFITQPALSTAIKQLEHQFGVALFTRNPPGGCADRRGSGGAAAGAERYTASIWRSKTWSRSRAPPRRIRVGYLIGTGADLLCRMVRHFKAAYPQITVEPTEFDFFRSNGRPGPISRPRWP